jgi:hypothetical protein
VTVRRVGLSTPLWVLAALVLGAVILVAVELANGAAGPVSPRILQPCRAHPTFPGGGVSGTVQRVVLEGLDGAACRLRTTREELVLSLSPSSTSRRWSRRQRETAIRAGLNHAIDAERRQGSIPGFLVPVLHRIVDKTPFDKLIQGSVTLGNLVP